MTLSVKCFLGKYENLCLIPLDLSMKDFRHDDTHLKLKLRTWHMGEG